MLLTHYDREAHIAYEKELSYEEGKAAGALEAYQEMNLSKEWALQSLVKHFNIREKDAVEYMEKYWTQP